MLSIARVTDISSPPQTSFGGSITTDAARASKPLRQVERAWILELKVVVKDCAIGEWGVQIVRNVCSP